VRYSATIKLDANQRVKVVFSGPHDSIRAACLTVGGALEMAAQVGAPFCTRPHGGGL